MLNPQIFAGAPTAVVSDLSTPSLPTLVPSIYLFFFVSLPAFPSLGPPPRVFT